MNRKICYFIRHLIAGSLAWMLIFPPSPTWGQVFNGDLVLTTQSAVDGFQYTHINGSLTVGSTTVVSTVANLDGLSDLEQVTGDFLIRNNPQLIVLEGPENLRTVRSLTIELNNNLSSIDGFASLESVDDSVRLYANSRLVSLDGFSSLGSVGRLSIEFNSQLEEIEAFPALMTVGGDVRLVSEALSRFPGLSSLTNVEGDVVIDAAGIDTLDGFSSLESIEGSLTISSRRMTRMDGFTALKKIGRDVWIDSQEVGSLDGLISLRLVGRDAVLMNCHKLTDIHGLDAITEIGGTLRIQGSGLEHLDAFPGLTTIGDSLWISSNPFLRSISGFTSLASVGEKLNIEDQHEMDLLGGFPVLEEVGSLQLYYIEAMVFDGFPALVHVKGDVYIEASSTSDSESELFTGLERIDGSLDINLFPVTDRPFPSLKTLGGDLNVHTRLVDGFRLLTSVSGDMYLVGGVIGAGSFEELASLGGSLELRTGGEGPLTGFRKLELVESDLVFRETTYSSFDGLSKLTTIGGDLVIESNNDLTQLDSLKSLETVAGDLDIYGNSSLESCGQGLSQLLCSEGVGGTLRIGPNSQLGHCNSIEEAVSDAACVPVPLEEGLELVSEFRLAPPYPNPFNRSLTIEFELPEAAAVYVTVLDALGRQVKSLVNGWRSPGKHRVTWDAQQLPSGVYLVRMEAAFAVEENMVVFAR